jgi:hypothetical protein
MSPKDKKRQVADPEKGILSLVPGGQKTVNSATPWRFAMFHQLKCTGIWQRLRAYPQAKLFCTVGKRIQEFVCSLSHPKILLVPTPLQVTGQMDVPNVILLFEGVDVLFFFIRIQDGVVL